MARDGAGQDFLRVSFHIIMSFEVHNRITSLIINNI